MLSEAELAVLDKFLDAENDFRDLVKCCDGDARDVRYHFRMLASIVMARSACRAHPDKFNTKEAFE